MANLRRFLSESQAARLVAGFHLGTLAVKDPLIQEPFDSPGRAYHRVIAGIESAAN
jgi:hypothetical protein